ncbi:peptidase dimerization domain-containing protein, partial [Sporosarcina sp. P29]|uniref:peptidase dimerization domain-containing protein n=2 Tax=Sporosarcina TaxID=1569 RepID=UPI001E34B01B
MKVKGNAAHIALNSEEGNNAFILAAAGLLKLNLGEIDDETLANIGIIEGGELTSIIPGEVTVVGEVRSFSKDKLNKQLQHMEDAMRKAVEDRGGSVDV